MEDSVTGLAKLYTLEEARALPVGTRVFAETNKNDRIAAMAFESGRAIIDDSHGELAADGLDGSCGWALREDGFYGAIYRVWSAEPTPDQTDAEPWGTFDHNRAFNRN